MTFFKRKMKPMGSVAKKNETGLLLTEYSKMDIDLLYSKLKTSTKGLSFSYCEELIDDIGENIIVTDRERGKIRRFFDSLINPFNIVLFIIAIITYVTDILIAHSGDYLTVIIILLLVFVSSIISFVQSERSNSAAAKLSKMISNTSHVIRDGEIHEINIEEIVPGDIVRLSAGDIIPADVRFINAKDAFVGQSALTGESQPVEKFIDIKEGGETVTDISNIGFLGTNMVSGSGLVVVLTTGNDTYFGSMAKSLSGDKAKNSFERGIESISSLLIRLMLIMVPTIFVINGIFKKDWLASMVFAVTMAVGLTPEMLPVIMTSTLARGAMAMAKKFTIVKNLSAIQAFGEMDILCTDKTGTLTEDKIILEKYMNVRGDEDSRVLRHAYLNSYFQTGLKNLIDVAIINRAENYDIDSIKTNYTKIDEIPFDFSRRRMSVVLIDGNDKKQLITKGAVEEIISICSHVEYKGQVLPLDEKMRDKAMGVYEKHNSDGLRVIAVAQKNYIEGIESFQVSDENEMVLLGFIGFLDPPKESSKAAISALKDHGVKTVVITGDSEGVAVKVCNKVGVDTSYKLTGNDVENMTDSELMEAVEKCSLFSKISPVQKERIVKTFQDKNHTVGYLGDGINDALALRQADVGVSVDSAVDIAKETADIILLKKDLMVLEEGVIEGRKTFGNIMKYINMAVSGNFGNMISVMIASIFLPFLPMLPIHILVQNLLCDFSQLGMPFDNVDEDYVMKPRFWDTDNLKRFMVVMGPLSSVFDIMYFVIMWYVLGANAPEHALLFQSGWFLFGTLSQIVIVHMIRTTKIPFVQSIASKPLLISTAIVSVIALALSFTSLGIGIDLAILPISFLPYLILVLLGYCLFTQIIKNIYIKKFDRFY